MAFLSEKTWERHANPWSGWTRVLAVPLLGSGLYFHSIWILGIAILWVLINPLVFPKPARTDNWMSKGVIGERLYLSKGKKFQKDLPTLLNVANIPVSISFLYFGWQQELMPLVLSGLLLMVIKFWFIDRMVALVDSRADKKEVLE